MEEKKLTDEEIVKAYKYCVLEDGHCNDCPYEDYGCAISAQDILDLINRQKAEIERLTEKVENQKSVIKGQDNRIKKEKAENQRLYDEYVRLDDFCAVKGCICCICENKKTCNECKSCGSLKTEKCNGFKIDVSKYARAIERSDNLQKQVDELTEERENMQAEIIATEESRLKAVKDTAKEVLAMFDDRNYITEKELKQAIAERYGLEVE